MHQAFSSVHFIENTSESERKKYKEELKFFLKLKKHIQTVFAESIDYKHYEPKIEKLLDKYIQASDMKTAVPLFDIYDSHFESELKDCKSDQSKALTILNRTAKYLSDNMERDRVFYEKLSKLLKKTLEDYQADRINEADLLKKAIGVQNQALTRTDETSLPPSLKNKTEEKAFLEF